MFAIQFFGGRGSGGGKRASGGGGGGDSAAAAPKAEKKVQKDTYAKAKDGELTVSEFNKLSRIRGAIHMDEMPVGTIITGVKGAGIKTTYVKQADGSWRPQGSTVVMGRPGAKVAESSREAMRAFKPNKIKYPYKP